MVRYIMNRAENMKSYLKKSDSDTYYENLEEWKKDYKPFLEQLFSLKTNSKKIYLDPYQDPDSHKTDAEEFYREMTVFLNAQEKAFQNLLNGHFKYELEEPANRKFDFPYIKVVEETNEKRKPLFYLKSDQFGFSFPSSERGGHPYNCYIATSINKEQAIDNVSKWIYESRSIGGVFLWPLEINKQGNPITNPMYNITRGGSCVRGSYIEDRVDLTLLEIKTVLDGEDSSLLADQYKNNMKIWLDHFKSFDIYTSFFCFDKMFLEVFVHDEEKKEKKELINIVDSDIEKNEYIALLKENINDYKRERRIYKIIKGPKGRYIGKLLLNNEELEKMLKNVNIMIRKRTEEMEKIIRSVM